ncbi:hypothetical protein SAMN05444287_1817 [Octadecabacter temperatus]|uniref:Integral membrane protein TerC family protein n=1 Tax=Octadecabacter temperatus TaxID=1458307 RepID=A0A0K0Y6V0_9RHOB|nr:DUF475 domain-containing protein [Octadecabacter temperatus]AKS46698.1 Integral membrane protein TerC family protein [Octadecabacter temperatus]SIO19522.1 hypothetical protein SAMN05444287_1817 [Octadecabacter temperatus]
MNSTLSYFRWPFGITAVGLALSFWLGFHTFGTLSGAMSFLLIGGILAVLEISLSFDNAIVNANILKTMEPVWQRRFLTWGILIAVFGMRIVFPLLVVVVAAQVGPVAAVVLAATDPQEYARIMDDAHIGISAFGGTFLMMVALTYFLDQSKEVDWIKFIEANLRKWASIRGLGTAIVLCAALLMSVALPEAESATFLFAAICGLVTFLAVELVAHFLDAEKETRAAAAKGGFGAFLYLEVLDASFSFDGVIGAFALTNNLFLIAIGLGIGAFYVRSMTIMLVERNTLSQFRYLEHGAFYSVLALSIIMYGQSIWHIPEVITGLIGAALIGLSLISSIRHNTVTREA